ncbi:hypothetical protein HUK65_08470 [Rhodobacteraceae bacterium 2376]|uniref:Uncharacterized protein n=1 Tax=Rhabdonatronobacter sediminivivens TaxID=2743469 RepID=A0A7Z0KYZ5_9RHOB|nr:hypothetical protein [Rhabdonatronobacter sediminivivens]NYS25026.1 hypothetical protein [Rhabdonatronobacter sediminivivens]
MKDWLKTASATFAGGAVAIALVAIPTYVWLPREFDRLNDGISIAMDASVEAAENTSKLLTEISEMKFSIARMDAKPINEAFLLIVADGITTNAIAPTYVTNFIELLPNDLVLHLYQSNKLSDFHYSSFGQKDWVFVPRRSFSGISAQEQQQVIESFERSGVEFRLE